MAAPELRIPEPRIPAPRSPRARPDPRPMRVLLAAGGIATAVAAIAFVDQRRKVRATRTAELAAGSHRDAEVEAATDAATPGDDALSR